MGAGTLATRDGFDRIYDIPASALAVKRELSALRAAQSIAISAGSGRIPEESFVKGFSAINFGIGADVDPWKIFSYANVGNPLIGPEKVGASFVNGSRTGNINWYVMGFASTPRDGDDSSQSMASIGLAGGKGNIDWNVGAGFSFESGGLLGERSSGLLETDGRTMAGFVSAGVGIDVADRLRLGLEGHAVQLGYRGDGVIAAVDGFGTSWAMSATLKDVFSEKDSLTVSLSQPLTIHSGNLDMNAIGRIPGTGSVGASRVSSAFSSGSNVLETGLAWSMPVAIAAGGRFSLGVSHRFDSRGTAISDTGVYGRLQFKF
jgi:hypothetical protein